MPPRGVPVGSTCRLWHNGAFRSLPILTDNRFVYISGDHGSGRIDKDVIFVDLPLTARLAQLLAAEIGSLGMDIVCGPATGRLIVARWTAFQLGLPAWRTGQYAVCSRTGLSRSSANRS